MIFRLDPRAKFSDGAPITSADVLFTFDLLKTKGRPQQRIAYGLVQAIEAPDAQHGPLRSHRRAATANCR